MNNKALGKYGEQIAQDFLKEKKYDILETNFRYSKFSEIDIIARKNDILHLIEVKTRSSNLYGTPFEAVTKTKLNSIYKCSKYYLSQANVRYKKIQIDVIGIIVNKDNTYEIKFLEDISL